MSMTPNPPRYETWPIADLVTEAVHLGLHRAVAQQMNMDRLIERCYTLWHQKHMALAE